MVNRTALNQAHLWGLVLAGGEGKRLEDYVRQLRGESLPKQYVNFIGTRSMLEHTLERAECLIPQRQVLTVITEHHLTAPAVRRQLADRTPGTVIVQPENKDTGPGILLPLTYLHKRCREAIVVLFPSDHFILEEDRFIDHVVLGVRAVEHEPAQIVLLAMEAQRAETEYGYVVPAAYNGHLDLCGCRRAAHFVEKPDLTQARLLIAAGALWNTMIMVFKVETLLGQIQTFYPDISNLFRALSAVIGTQAERRKIEEIYRQLPPLNFSKDILERITVHFPAAISVLPVLQVTWSDWGSPRRIGEIKEAIGHSVRSNHPLTQPPAPVQIPPSPTPPLPRLRVTLD